MRTCLTIRPTLPSLLLSPTMHVLMLGLVFCIPAAVSAPRRGPFCASRAPALPTGITLVPPPVAPVPKGKGSEPKAEASAVRGAAPLADPGRSAVRGAAAQVPPEEQTSPGASAVRGAASEGVECTQVAGGFDPRDRSASRSEAREEIPEGITLDPSRLMTVDKRAFRSLAFLLTTMAFHFNAGCFDSVIASLLPTDFCTARELPGANTLPSFTSGSVLLGIRTDSLAPLPGNTNLRSSCFGCSKSPLTAFNSV